jgi:hypothetical protein
MAPLDQYLMADRDAEIALALSAAPPSISSDATVMLLGRHGYETAVEGKNGFVCIEERAWNGSFEKDREFWNPKYRSPLCFNPLAALRTPDDEYALRHPHGQERGVVRNDVGPSETAKHADV